MSKIYSVVIKGYRIDVTEDQLNTIRKGTTLTDGGRKFVHLFIKGKMVSILKDEFETAIRALLERKDDIAKDEPKEPEKEEEEEYQQPETDERV